MPGAMLVHKLRPVDFIHLYAKMRRDGRRLSLGAIWVPSRLQPAPLALQK